MKHFIFFALALLFLTALTVLAPSPIYAVNFFTVTHITDSGAGTLRQAITDANAVADASHHVTIKFDIAGNGIHTIRPHSALPTVYPYITIDGYTQQGSSKNTLVTGDNASLRIELDGSHAGEIVSGLVLHRAAVRGLAVNRFSKHGVELYDGGIVDGSFIGTDPLGQTAHGNANAGVFIQATSASCDREHRVGSKNVGGRNVISGNATGIGVEIDLSGGVPPPTCAVKILNNYVGVTADGAHAIPNLGDGVFVHLLGSSVTLRNNVLSANSGYGLDYSGLFLGTVQHNKIGTDATGTVELGNSVGGIYGNGGEMLIGGVHPADANVISANHGTGIYLTHYYGHTIQGNLIGTDVSGTHALGNQGYGIDMESFTQATIGVADPGERGANVISANTLGGIYIHDASYDSTILGNFIGTDRTGKHKLGNGGNGITVAEGSHDITIGDGLGEDNSTPLAPNHIAGNTGAGIAVQGLSTSAILIAGNAISANGGPGIDLGSNGVTPNDALDTDIGPNGALNFPILTSAVSSTKTVSGTYSGFADSDLTLRVYAIAKCDSSGYGEGLKFLGYLEIHTDETGAATFSGQMDKSFASGVAITATASYKNSTSEFSACKTAS